MSRHFRALHAERKQESTLMHYAVCQQRARCMQINAHREPLEEIMASKTFSHKTVDGFIPLSSLKFDL